MAQNLRIALVQENSVVGDISGNLAMALAACRSLSGDADLVAFPELFSCGYPPEDLVLKPSFLDEIENSVHDFAEKIGSSVHVLLPTPWRVDGQVYNAVHLIGHGRILDTRTKHHLPNYGVFDEKRVFSPGPLPEPVDVSGFKIGVMICEDTWFPDVAGHLASSGAELILSVNASPFETGKWKKRRDICARRVGETSLPVLYLNLTGGQDDLVFDGGSFILDGNGECVSDLPQFASGVLSVTLARDPEKKTISLSPDAPPVFDPQQSDESELYAALVTGLRDYIVKNNFPGILLGMSGGIDSALSAVIAADAIGADKVRCVMLPSRYTSQESIDDAKACCDALGIGMETISIESSVAAFEDVLSPALHGRTEDITRQNIQSRCRGLILMALSNACGNMVLSTGNKSEIAVGYATLYGDMCGGYNALKDVYKTDVYKIAAWRNAHVPENGLGADGTVIPDVILTKPPTAELKPGQTDQDTLPPYDVLDDILRGLIEEDLNHTGIAARGHDLSIVAHIARLVDLAEYKRRQAAPGIKTTTRAFGRDRRYPITNRFGRQRS